MRNWTILVTIAVLSAVPLLAHAQNGDRAAAHSVFTRPVEVGAYLSADANIGRLNGTNHVLAGADIGVLLNHRFSLALTGEGLVNGDEDDASSTTDDRLRFGYGGISLGYVIAPTSMLHYVADVTVAGGSVRHKTDEPNTDDDGDHIFVLQPSISAEVNLSRYFRAAAGVSYRAVSGVNLSGLSNADLSGIALRLVVRAGRF